jgi:hypothetical protein
MQSKHCVAVDLHIDSMTPLLVHVWSEPVCCVTLPARNLTLPSLCVCLLSLPVTAARSSKVAVSLATGGLVPHLLEPLTAGLTGAAAAAPNSQAAATAAAAGGSPASAPILRAKLLEVVRIMYQHYPRPKEFIMKYRIQVGLGGYSASSEVQPCMFCW